MEPQLPKLFGLLPRSKVDVRPVEEYREKEFAAAEYYQGTPDGSRAGAVIVNTGDYQHRSLIEVESTAYHETDRYIVVPAQALGYKLGQLDIQRLRQRAQAELGSGYDVRAFHDEILNGGALPLDVLDERVAGWIKARKNTQATSVQTPK